MCFFSQRRLVFTQEDEAPDHERSVPQQNYERGDCDNYVDVADGGELTEDGDPDDEEDTSVGAVVVHLGIPEAENLDESSPLRDRVFDALAAMCGTCRWIPTAEFTKEIHATEEEVEVALQFWLDLGVFEVAECLAFATPIPDT